MSIKPFNNENVSVDRKDLMLLSEVSFFTLTNIKTKHAKLLSSRLNLSEAANFKAEDVD